ncbi:MAG: cellulase family glycosylhydrolase [Chthonomonadales bacterium]
MEPGVPWVRYALLMIGCLLTSAAGWSAPSSPRWGAVIPQNLGVNIHFTDPRPGEMQELASAGFRWVRMDFSWEGTEREKGRYDFSAYDRLMAALRPYGIHALFILDYSNRHYDGGLSPHTEEGRAAMARWAAAAARHFRGQGILWEMYNEPNIGFWRPKPNVQEYISLALEVGKAIRAAAPGEAYIGPATSGMDFGFLEACFKAGLLKYWDAVSVHPYRGQPPETVSPDYRRLRLLIAKYAPKGKAIPILSGEWGYSSVWRGMDEATQGRMLARQWLTNLMNRIPVSIWYDWHDDGPDPREPEHHFGTVRYPYREGEQPVYEPKPAYRAAETLTSTLAGFVFNKRLDVGHPDDYALLFSRGSDVRLVVWTTSGQKHPIRIPASDGTFRLINSTGGVHGFAQASSGVLTLDATEDPVYAIPSQPNDLLSVAAAWESAPMETLVRAGGEVEVSLILRNPLNRTLRVLVRNGHGAAGTFALDTTLLPGASVPVRLRLPMERSAEPVPVRVEVILPGLGGRIAQQVVLVASNPLVVEASPMSKDVWPVTLLNPIGEPFNGALRVVDPSGFRPASRVTPIRLHAGTTRLVVPIAVTQTRTEYSAGVVIADVALHPVLTLPQRRYRLVDDFSRYPSGAAPFAYRLVADGDAKVASELELVVTTPPSGLGPGFGAVRITYRFAAGWKFARLAPQTDAVRQISGQPLALLLWVYGDGSGNLARLRFTDASGQTFQPDGGAINFKGWKLLSFPLQGSTGGHWGGADDGVIHYPIHFDTLFLVDSARGQETGGTLYLAAPTLVYDMQAK